MADTLEKVASAFRRLTKAVALVAAAVDRIEQKVDDLKSADEAWRLDESEIATKVVELLQHQAAGTRRRRKAKRVASSRARKAVHQK